jgi:hypothetical protein
MKTTFTELVIEGPFILVKGFLMGYWATQDHPPRYFFHRKAGIRRQTLRDLMVELFELENMVHLCLEDSAVPTFEVALEKAGRIIGLKVRSKRKVLSASFQFSYEVYNRELADACQELIQGLPEGVSLSGHEPIEEVTHHAGPELSAGYAPEPLFALRGKGNAQGDFDGLIKFYLACRHSKAAPFMLLGEVDLTLE